jgi:HEAT repeat protein
VIAAIEDPTRDTPLVALEEQLETDLLVATLESAARPQTRSFLCHVLGTRGDPAALPALLRRLDDEETKVRAAAADSIGKIGIALRRRGVTPHDEIGRALVSHYLPGESPWLVSAVGAVGYLDGVDFLEQVLRAEDPDVRAAAAWALGELGSRDSADALETALARERNQHALRQIEEAVRRLRLEP